MHIMVFDKKHRNYFLLAIVSALLLLVLVGSVLIVDRIIYPKLEDTRHERKTIWHEGVSYFPRQDIRVFLFMGIDRVGPVVDSGSYKSEGAADVILVFIFNDTEKQYTVLALNRDSMVQMQKLGIGGKPAGSITAQLALSHTYGNGLQQSCINTRETVSNLLSGITIHQYVSMNMDAISMLTDAVGGVRVNVTDDFSTIDSSLKKGEIILNGDQAYKFLRTRKDIGDQLNLSRMDRHKEFMAGFEEAYRKNIGDSISKAMEIYNDISPYVVTDCSDNTIANLLNRLYDYKLVDILSPAGTNVRGEEYMEFYIDEEDLFQLVLRLLYEPKNSNS